MLSTLENINLVKKLGYIPINTIYNKNKSSPIECLHGPVAIQGVSHILSLIFSTKYPKMALTYFFLG